MLHVELIKKRKKKKRRKLPAAELAGQFNAERRTLRRYLTWIPLGYIFETQLIPILLTYFWDPMEYRLECIKYRLSLRSRQAPLVAEPACEPPQ